MVAASLALAAGGCIGQSGSSHGGYKGADAKSYDAGHSYCAQFVDNQQQFANPKTVRRLMEKVASRPAWGAGCKAAMNDAGGGMGNLYENGASGPKTTTTNTAAERALIKADVAKWKANHPGGTCTIHYPDSAECTTADGLPVDMVVDDSTTVTGTNP